MPIYEIRADGIVRIQETRFEDESIQERGDLQPLLRSQIEVVSPATRIIAEEFGEWEDSNRRIDLLGVDEDGNLVVIELKRTRKGEHMDLQALRYAAMVSTMTFEKAVEVYGAHLAKLGRNEDAENLLLEFLGWEEPDEDRFAQDVRIVLVSADFSKELTTAVMWLNERSLDIRCVRMQPYKDGERVLLDVQQVLPLPEAEDYTIKLREKATRERINRQGRTSSEEACHRFWAELLPKARTRTQTFARVSPGNASWIASTAGVVGLSLVFVVGGHDARAELYIDKGKGSQEANKAIFDSLYQRKAELEDRFGDELEWQRLDDKQACRVRKVISLGGYRDEETWPEVQEALIDNMVRLERALSPVLSELK